MAATPQTRPLPAPGPSTLMQQLREQTRGEHATIERTLDLMQPHLGLPRYAAILRAFHGMYRPLEQSLQDIIGPAFPAWDLSARLKRPLLERDLRALDCAEGPVADTATLPHIHDVPTALGCLYVMEGATLGGQVITREVCGRLGLTPEHGGAFFNGYGSDTGRRWRDFQEFIISHSTVGDTMDIVAGARDTFARLDAWFRLQLASIPAVSPA